MSKSDKIVIKRHFVTFFCPGTFMSENVDEPISSWDVEKARKMAKKITVRYGAKPYGFRFHTSGRGERDLNAKVIKTSPMYFMGGKVRTAEEILAGEDPEEKILRSNVRNNSYKRIFETTEGWKWSTPMADDDVHLP